jgi:hypothetical protein
MSMQRSMKSTTCATRALVAILGGSLAVLSALAAPAWAATPAPSATSARTLTLTDADGQKYQAVVTIKVLQAPTASTPEVQQPALTIYKVTSSGRDKIWSAPPTVIPRVERVSKDPMGWLPLELLVGPLTPVSLLPGKGQQLAFTVHQAGADCGSSSIPVIGLGGGSPRMLVSVSNFCELGFTVAGKSLVLTGPAYKSTDPLCCPSTPKASAKLTYQNGAWKLAPHYFRLVVPPKG